MVLSMHSLFSCFIIIIWTLSLILNCKSHYCPNPSTQKHQTSFCFQPPHNNTFSKQLAQMFPAQGDKSGYCVQQFHDDPPENSEYGLIGTYVVIPEVYVPK